MTCTMRKSRTKFKEEFFELELELTKSETSESGESDSDQSHDGGNVVFRKEEPPEKKPRVLLGTWKTGLFTPTRFGFDSYYGGAAKHCIVSADVTESECFKLFFDLELMNLITEHTNAFATVSDLKDYSDETNSCPWTRVTVPEMYSLLACLLLMGLVRKDSVEDYWASDPLTETPCFARAFTRNRFLLLLRAVHVSSLNGQQEFAPSSQTHRIIAHLKSRFGTFFQPFQELRIQSFSMRDGTLSPHPPQLSEQPRPGIQLVALSDVKTGYILNFEIRTGNTSADAGVALGGMFSVSLTLDLIKPYFRKGHVLYTDDQHNSPGLFRYLHKLGTSACGPVRLAWMPSFSQETEFLHTDLLLAVKRQGAEHLPLLSSVHATSMAINSEGEDEPECVADYNRVMGSSEQLDTRTDYADFGRTLLGWYHKLLLQLMAITVRNAFIIYQSLSHKTTTFHRFQLNLIAQLLQLSKCELQVSEPPSAAEDLPPRLSGRHFPQPLTQDGAADHWCFVCKNTTTKESQLVETKYMCVDCHVPLCVVPCFETYHTQLDY